MGYRGSCGEGAEEIPCANIQLNILMLRSRPPLTMHRRSLPIGIQTFRKIREGNFYYVDKTSFALRLIEGTRSDPLRPRRASATPGADSLTPYSPAGYGNGNGNGNAEILCRAERLPAT